MSNLSCNLKFMNVDADEPLGNKNERSIVFARPKGNHERLWTMEGS